MFKISANVDLSNAQEMLAAAPAEIRNAQERALLWGLNLLVRAWQQNISSPYCGFPPAVARGNMLHAVFGEPVPGPIVAGVVDVYPPADVYAGPMETGTRPHFPPVDVIALWVNVRLGIADEKEARSVAWAIAQTIAKRGTAGRHIVERAFTANEQAVIDRFNEEVEAAVAAFNDWKSQGGGAPAV